MPRVPSIEEEPTFEAEAWPVVVEKEYGEGPYHRKHEARSHRCLRATEEAQGSRHCRGR